MQAWNFFFFYIFPICILSDFVISKLAFLIHYFSVSVSELGWIVLQPSSPFRQNHSACSLNSTHFLRVWIYFQIEKNKHSRDTIQEIQELGGWALYPWTGEERQGLGVSGCQQMPDLQRTQWRNSWNREHTTWGKTLCTVREELLKSLFQKLIYYLCKTIMSCHSLSLWLSAEVPENQLTQSDFFRLISKS